MARNEAECYFFRIFVGVNEAFEIITFLDAGFHRHDEMITTVTIFNKLLDRI